MMDLQDQFDEAVERSKSLPSQPNDVLLELYSLYKQATAGDAAGSRPGAFDFVGRAKYDAWSKRAGMARDDAMRAYVDLVSELGAR
jgi:acyl-CoA-binding protein